MEKEQEQKPSNENISTDTTVEEDKIENQTELNVN